MQCEHQQVMQCCPNCFKRAFANMHEMMGEIDYKEAHFEGVLLGVVAYSICKVMSTREVPAEVVCDFYETVKNMTDGLHKYVFEDQSTVIDLSKILRMAGLCPQEEVATQRYTDGESIH